METIYRAQAILKTVQSVNKRNAQRTDVQKREYGIMEWIDNRYKEYKDLCDWCGEVPLSKGKWLLQQVKPVGDAK